MPLYFFHLENGSFSPDTAGSELSSLQDARIEAVAYTAEMLKARAEIVWSGGVMQIQVSDESDKLLFNIEISIQEPGQSASAAARA